MLNFSMSAALASGEMEIMLWNVSDSERLVSARFDSSSVRFQRHQDDADFADSEFLRLHVSCVSGIVSFRNVARVFHQFRSEQVGGGE